MSSFLVPGDYPGDTTNTTASGGVDNQVNLYKFMLPVQIEVSNISVNVIAASATKVVGVGLYLLSWTSGPSLLISSGSMSAASTGIKTHSFTKVVLPQGWYYWAWTGTGAAKVLALAEDPDLISLLNVDTTMPGVGIAGNPAVAGDLPPALGSVTAGSLDIVIGYLS